MLYANTGLSAIVPGVVLAREAVCPPMWDCLRLTNNTLIDQHLQHSTNHLTGE